MSIWNYQTDIELGTLRTLNQEIDEAKYELARVETALDDQASELEKLRALSASFTSSVLLLQLAATPLYCTSRRKRLLTYRR